MKRSRDTPFGVAISGAGARFRLWAPSAQRVTLCARASGGALEADLRDVGEGWFELTVGGLDAGATYRYRIDGDIEVPDPASRFNPQGVQGASQVVDPRAFEWRDGQWRGRSWSEAVVYELHVGAFTPQGTYAAAAERLDSLAELGVTAIELLPVAAFPGERGWGYDGVLQYAPHAAYGAPDDLKRFIEAAHARNLMVLLDVVYNHFGPEGNYLGRYARDFFTSRHHTPWGEAINFEHPVVRQFFIENALYWLEEYHFDGLRIDAVHAMCDDSALHFIDELVAAAQDGPGRERSVHIVLENHHNEARRLQRNNAAVGASSIARNAHPISGLAQWNDDSHHALHVLMTGEGDGYYVDYADGPLRWLGRILTQGFGYQGERSTFSGKPRGEASVHLPAHAFVDFLQNHDQIGNRAYGERISQLAPPERLRAAYELLLLSPHIPMLFMGEEYAASQPFLYFCDYQGELADAVRNGRRAEFAGFGAFADERARESIPDPNARATFERSRLDWSERTREPHAQLLSLIRELLQVRAQHIAPRIAQVASAKAVATIARDLLDVRWPLTNGGSLRMQANFSDAPAEAEVEGEVLHPVAHDAGALAPWQVRVMLAA